MYRKHRSCVLTGLGLAACAFALSCSSSSPSGSSTASAGGSSGSAGSSGVSGSTGSGGATAAGGSLGSGGGSAGGAGGTAGGATGTGGGGAGGSAGTGAGGSGGGTSSSGCGSPAGLESGRASIDVGGKMREYILRVPDNYDPNHPYKLIFGWHPWGGSAQLTENMGYFSLENVSDNQAILVAPEGQPYEDDRLGWANEGGEDIAFLHAMVDRFSSELCVDQERIFSTGFSFGAMFSFTLACTEMSMMRAIAPMAGNTFASGGCENSDRPVAVMAFIGTEDSLLEGHRDAVQIFVERNGCTAETMPVQPSWCDGLDEDNLPCTCVAYQGCSAGYPVIECEFNDDHVFAPNSGQALWDFFSQF